MIASSESGKVLESGRRAGHRGPQTAADGHEGDPWQEFKGFSWFLRGFRWISIVLNLF